MIAQIQREREFVADRRGLDVHRAARVADSEKSGQSPALSLEGIHRKRFMTTATGVHNMILKAAC